MKQKSEAKPALRISRRWLDLPRNLFGHLESVVGELGAEHQRLALVLEILRIEEHIPARSCRMGRPPASRTGIAQAFVAKATLNFATTAQLIRALKVDVRLRHLCGFFGRVPSESVFSRAFSEFAQMGLGNIVHEHLVKHHLGHELVHHLSRDSTAVPARERSARPPLPVKLKRAKKPGRPRRGECRELSGLKKQLVQDWREAVAELPVYCGIGAKIGQRGRLFNWAGYKLHADIGDGGLPVSLITTSASCHDCRVAIPLMRMSCERVGGILYQLMDRGYVSHVIQRAVEELGHVALVQPKGKRNQPAVPFDPARQERFKARNSAERFFSDLHDNHGGRFVRVRGHAKVHLHLVFGALTIFALNILRL